MTIFKAPSLPDRLWRLETDPTGRGIAAEVRLLDKKAVSYYFLEFEAEAPSWRPVVQGASWWSGLLSLRAPTLLTHSYASPDLPIRKGISAWDVHAARLVWSNEALEPRRMGENAILCKVSDTGPEIWVSIENGAMLPAAGHEAVSRHRTPVTANILQVNLWLKHFGIPGMLQYLPAGSGALLAGFVENIPRIALFREDELIYTSLLDAEYVKPGSSLFYQENARCIWLEPGAILAWTELPA